MKRIIISCWLFVSIFQVCIAQSKIYGTVTDTNGSPVAYANVLLLKATDSSLVKGTIATAEGTYTFQNIPAGQYLIRLSYTGFKQVYSLIFNLAKDEDKNMHALKMQESNVQLQSVTVQAKKPLFEQEIDRTVINVKDQIIASGGTALDVLEKSPGVIVNRQDNSISINGKNGVVVMINGKIMNMPMDALVQMLSSMQASNINKIELITTPPAKYDAEGNAGYINIVLVNNPNMGFNGSYAITMSYNKGEMPGANFNFNYRHKKINFYGNYSFTRLREKQLWSNYRKIENGGETIITSTGSHRDATTPYNNLRLGLDYQADSNTVIGALITGYDRYWKMNATNYAAIAVNNVTDTTITTDNHEINHSQTLLTNMNLQHTFKPGEVLSVDLNYIYYKDNNPNYYDNTYFNGKEQFLFNENAQSGKVTPIHFWIAQSDYTKGIGKKIEMETGIKMSLSRFNNDVSVLNNQVIDKALSANYFLKENIGAAYASFTFNFNEKNTMKAGLRYEYTSSNLGTTETKNIVNRKYGQLFPTFYVSHKLNKENTINFSYNRRITRPTFRNLAPYTIFLDPSTFITGNPALQPAISNSVQASYTFRDFIFSVNYTYEQHTISGFQSSVNISDNKQYISAINLDNLQHISASASLPFIVTKWWSMQNNLSLNRNMTKEIYNSSPVTVKAIYYNIISTQSFTLPKGISFELTAFYRSASIFGINKLSPLEEIDFGGRKKFKNNKSTLSFAITDIFGTAKYRFINDMPAQHFYILGDYNFMERAFAVTYTHNFGDKALKAKRKRATGSEEELDRVNP